MKKKENKPWEITISEDFIFALKLAGAIIFMAFVIFITFSCNDDKPVVNSPFSHLDTVKTKAVEKEEKQEPKEKKDGTTFSPFDNIKK